MQVVTEEDAGSRAGAGGGQGVSAALGVDLGCNGTLDGGPEISLQGVRKSL